MTAAVLRHAAQYFVCFGTIIILSILFTATGNGHRRRRARPLVHDKRGNRGRGRERQRSGNAEKSVPVQNPRDAARAGATGPGEQHSHCGDGRNRRTARQKAVDAFRAQRHRGTRLVQGRYNSKSVVVF